MVIISAVAIQSQVNSVCLGWRRRGGEGGDELLPNDNNASSTAASSFRYLWPQSSGCVRTRGFATQIRDLSKQRTREEGKNNNGGICSWSSTLSHFQRNSFAGRDEKQMHLTRKEREGKWKKGRFICLMGDSSHPCCPRFPVEVLVKGCHYRKGE